MQWNRLAHLFVSSGATRRGAARNLQRCGLHFTRCILTTNDVASPTAREEVWNLPNKLTVLRLGMTAVLVVAMEVAWPYRYSAGLLLFVAASITDYLDGAIARSRNLITNFGKLMDPLVDKILTAAAFICLVALDDVPSWVAITIISREFLITGLRLLAASSGQVLPAEKLGKHKTAWQIITIVFFLLLRSLSEWGLVLTPPVTNVLEGILSPLLLGITVALTLYSGLAYCWKNRALIAPGT